MWCLLFYLTQYVAGEIWRDASTEGTYYVYNDAFIVRCKHSMVKCKHCMAIYTHACVVRGSTEGTYCATMYACREASI